MVHGGVKSQFFVRKNGEKEFYLGWWLRWWNSPLTHIKQSKEERRKNKEEEERTTGNREEKDQRKRIRKMKEETKKKKRKRRREESMMEIARFFYRALKQGLLRIKKTFFGVITQNASKISKN